MEGGLPFVALRNTDQVIGVSEVKLPIDLHSARGF